MTKNVLSKNIRKRTLSRPISFYYCNERTFFFSLKTVDLKQSNEWKRNKTRVNSLQNVKVTLMFNVYDFFASFLFFIGEELTDQKKKFIPIKLPNAFRTPLGRKQTIYIFWALKKYNQTFHFRSFILRFGWLLFSFILNEIKVVTFTGIVCHLSVCVYVCCITWIRFEWKCPKHEQKAPRKIKPLTTIIKRVSRCIKCTQNVYAKATWQHTTTTITHTHSQVYFMYTQKQNINIDNVRRNISSKT